MKKDQEGNLNRFAQNRKQTESSLRQKLQNVTRKTRMRRLLAFLSAIVVFFTMNTLKYDADTLEHTAMCHLEAHSHTEACFDEAGQIICGLEEHIHTDACYQQRPSEPEPTRLDEFLDINAGVNLTSPLTAAEVPVEEAPVEELPVEELPVEEAPVEVVSEEVEAPVEEVTLSLDEVDSEGTQVSDSETEGLTILYDDEADANIPTYYNMDHSDVAFLSDVLNACGLAAADITSVGEVEDNAFVFDHISVEPVEGVADEYMIKVVRDFEFIELGIFAETGMFQVTLLNGAAVKETPAPVETELPEIEEAEQTEITAGEETAVTEPAVVEQEAEAPAEDAADTVAADKPADAESEEIVDADNEIVTSETDAETEEPETADAESEETETETADAESEETEEDEADAGSEETETDKADAGSEETETETADAESEETETETADAESEETEEDEADAESEETEEDEADAESEETEEDEADTGSNADEAVSDVAVEAEAPAAVVTLNFADYVAVEAHDVYEYDALAAVVRVNTAEIADVEGVQVIVPEVVAAEPEVEAAAEPEVNVDIAPEVDDVPGAEVESVAEAYVEPETEAEAASEPEAAILVITGDGEHVVNGTAYIVENLTLPVAVIEGDGSDAEVDSDKEITISSASGEAVLPDAEPVFTEMDKDTSEYEDIFSLFAEAEDDPAQMAKLAELFFGVAHAEAMSARTEVTVFDIGLRADGEQVEPGAMVHVSTSFAPISGSGFELYHIVYDDEGRPHKEDVPGAQVIEENGCAVGLDFEIASMSPFALVYTVDFHWNVDGEAFEYSLPGGDTVSLRELLPLLSVIDGETDIDAFIGGIERVEFSNSDLVRVVPVTEDITAGELKRVQGIESEYSAELTDDQIAEMDARALHAPDWALVSLKPFDSEETLTVVMKTGEVFTIAVTDAQIKKTWLSKSGETFEIVVDYDDDALIPSDAELQVEEIPAGTDAYEAYLAKSANELGVEGSEVDFARFFDITILADGEEIQPQAPVKLTIELAEELTEDVQAVHFENATEDPENAEAVLMAATLSNPENLNSAVSMDAEGFSVWGVVKVPAPATANDLDGYSVKISNLGYYLGAENITVGESRRLSKTNNEADAPVWTFESTGTAGRYYISTTTSEGKQYINISYSTDDRGDVTLSDTPQALTVLKNDSNYRICGTNNGKTYFINQYGNTSGTGFAGWWYNGSAEAQLDFTFVTELAHTEGEKQERDYMVVVKQGNRYYVVMNDGTLSPADYNPDDNTVVVDDPMMWKYSEKDGGRRLYHVTREAGFTYFDTASDSYYRYIDPNSPSGWSEDNEENTTRTQDENGRNVSITER